MVDKEKSSNDFALLSVATISAYLLGRRNGAKPSVEHSKPICDWKSVDQKFYTGVSSHKLMLSKLNGEQLRLVRQRLLKSSLIRSAFFTTYSTGDIRGAISAANFIKNCGIAYCGSIGAQVRVYRNVYLSGYHMGDFDSSDSALVEVDYLKEPSFWSSYSNEGHAFDNYFNHLIASAFSDDVETAGFKIEFSGKGFQSNFSRFLIDRVKTLDDILSRDARFILDPSLYTFDQLLEAIELYCITLLEEINPVLKEFLLDADLRIDFVENRFGLDSFIFMRSNSKDLYYSKYRERLFPNKYLTNPV